MLMDISLKKQTNGQYAPKKDGQQRNANQSCSEVPIQTHLTVIIKKKTKCW